MKAFHHALVGILLYCFGVALALAQQQILVPTRPPGDSTNAAASTAFVTNALPIVNVLSFGVVGNGVTDDGPNINNAIAAGAGGVVIFPHGLNYALATGLVVGNGSSSAVSTVTGTILLGMGNPASIAAFGPFQQSTGPLLTWIGGASANVIAIHGPLMGWGVNNLKINCNSAATVTGLSVVSAEFGDSSNLTFINCQNSIYSHTVPLFDSITITDSFHNYWRNINIIMPSIATSMGILLSGAGSGNNNTNTDVNVFINTSILVTTTASTVAYGIYLQQTDTDQFIDTHIYGGNSSSVGVLLDYSVTSGWPSGVTFYGIDVGTGNGSGGFLNNGIPGAAATPNYVYGLGEGNGGACPNIANLAAYCSHRIELATPAGGNVVSVQTLAGTAAYNFNLPTSGAGTANQVLTSAGGGSNAMTWTDIGAWSAWAPSASCGTATFTVNSARIKTIGKTTFAALDLKIATLGTCTGTITLNLPNTTNSAAGLAGREYINSGSTILCDATAGLTALSCTKNNSSGQTQNFVLNDSILVSGVYENQ